MENHGIVIRLEGNQAIVEIRPPDGGCGRCHETGGCGSNLLNESLRPKKLNQYRLPNTLGAKPGDAVILTLPEGALLRAACLAYLFPAILLILGAALGKYLSPDPLASLSGAAAGLLTALLILRLLQKTPARHGLFTQASPTLRLRREDENQARCHANPPTTP